MSTDPQRADVESPDADATIPEAVVQDPTEAPEPGAADGEAPDTNVRTREDSREGPAEGEASGSAAVAESQEDGPSSRPASARSPAEAFTALGEEVHLLRADVDDIGSFVRVCRDKLIRQAGEYQLEGMHAVLESLMRLHDLVYRQVTTMESGNARPDAFILNLFATIEAELQTHGVEVVRPQPGEEVNLEVMTTIGAMPCPFWRKPDRVAQINGCGFVLSTESERRILRKAEITVFRR